MKLPLVKIHRKKLIDKGGSFFIYIVAHDGMFTVISRVNCCRVNCCRVNCCRVNCCRVNCCRVNSCRVNSCRVTLKG